MFCFVWVFGWWIRYTFIRGQMDADPNGSLAPIHIHKHVDIHMYICSINQRTREQMTGQEARVAEELVQEEGRGHDGACCGVFDGFDFVGL